MGRPWYPRHLCVRLPSARPVLASPYALTLPHPLTLCPQVKEKNPGFTLGEMGKALGAMWKDLTDKEKVKYEDLAKKDKERYEKEKAKYQAGK